MVAVVGALCSAVPTMAVAEVREGISIAEGFQKLWKETGIDRKSVV